MAPALRLPAAFPVPATPPRRLLPAHGLRAARAPGPGRGPPLNPGRIGFLAVLGPWRPAWRSPGGESPEPWGRSGCPHPGLFPAWLPRRGARPHRRCRSWPWWPPSPGHQLLRGCGAQGQGKRRLAAIVAGRGPWARLGVAGDDPLGEGPVPWSRPPALTRPRPPHGHDLALAHLLAGATAECPTWPARRSPPGFSAELERLLHDVPGRTGRRAGAPRFAACTTPPWPGRGWPAVTRPFRWPPPSCHRGGRLKAPQRCRLNVPCPQAAITPSWTSWRRRGPWQSC